MILMYSFLTKRKEIVTIFYLSLISIVIYLFTFSTKEIQEFILNSIQFSNNSSLGHVIEWINGLDAMIEKPLGMGLGTSGRVTANVGDAIGGENQFIIVGVQIGIAGLLLYVTIYFYSMIQAYFLLLNFELLLIQDELILSHHDDHGNHSRLQLPMGQ